VGRAVASGRVVGVVRAGVAFSHHPPPTRVLIVGVMRRGCMGRVGMRDSDTASTPLYVVVCCVFATVYGL
jgi:hypothetical protein